MRLGLALVLTATAGSTDAQVWRADQGDGTYRNPILFADYPDPDIIRVGTDFYFVSTTFANSPGVTLLHSKDLVNWRLAGHVVSRLNGNPKFDLQNGGSYRNGFFAASLRFNAGTFYVAVTPVGMMTRIYSSKSIAGPWTYSELDRQAFDPGLFFDDDGAGYIITSVGSDGTITLLTLNEDHTRVANSRVVYYNKGAEGSKLVKRNGWYYLFNARPGKLALLVSRARKLDGPWETRPQIDDTSGGHQGAIVDMADGSDYGFVMIDAGSIGRMTNISPVHWKDGWPVWGTPQAPGRVPEHAEKPIQGKQIIEPAASDDFSASQLGLQWQWNHNPDNSRWSLTQRPGFLRLSATTASSIWIARNTLTQKGQGPYGRGEVQLDVRGIRLGDICGFGTFGKVSAQLSVVGGPDGARSLTMRVTESMREGPKVDVRLASLPISGTQLWLRTDTDFVKNVGKVAYSLNRRRWTYVGGSFPLVYDWRAGTFQGQQFAISCYNPAASSGYLDVDKFVLSAPPSITSVTAPNPPKGK